MLVFWPDPVLNTQEIKESLHKYLQYYRPRMVTEGGRLDQLEFGWHLLNFGDPKHQEKETMLYHIRNMGAKYFESAGALSVYDSQTQKVSAFTQPNTSHYLTHNCGIICVYLGNLVSFWNGMAGMRLGSQMHTILARHWSFIEHMSYGLGYSMLLISDGTASYHNDNIFTAFNFIKRYSKDFVFIPPTVHNKRYSTDPNHLVALAFKDLNLLKTSKEFPPLTELAEQWKVLP